MIGNSELQERMAEQMEFAVSQTPEALAAENAELRELVRDMYKAFMHGNCYRWCEFKEPCNGDRCQYRDRMRELGIEVDE